MSEKAFQEREFYKQFEKDLKSARLFVLIQSPFISPRQIDQMKPVLSDCIVRAVRVCVFVQKPKDFDARSSAAKQSFLTAIDYLQQLGIHVSVRKGIHEKLIVLDGHVVWDGSLNVLSHFDTYERMTRWESKEKAEEVIRTHKLDGCDYCSTRLDWCLFMRSKIPSEPDRCKLLGHMVSHYRKSFKLSQRQLAESCGITQKSLSDLELGKRVPSMRTLFFLSRRLGIEAVLVPWYLVPSLYKLPVVSAPKKTKPKKNPKK